MSEWDNTQPIYQQLSQKLIAMILKDTIKSGEMMPSVRQLASEFQLNPITVTKAYQLLANDDLLEKRRGMGMFVKPETKKRLITQEKERFLQDEWPSIRERMNMLGIDWKEID